MNEKYYRGINFLKRVLNLKLTVLFFIILVSFITYLNILPNNFVYDDESEILKNPWIRDAKFIPDVFLSHSWAFKYTDSTSSHYHPLKLIANMLQYRLFGARPWGYHLTSMLAHIIITVMVFFVVASIFKQAFNEDKIVFPFISSLLFAVHPVHTEAVAWISAMSELFMSFFYLLSFLFYIGTSEGCRGFIISAIFFFVAALFKETAMTLPLLLITYDYSFKRGIFVGDLKVKAVRNFLYKRYIPFIIVTIAYFLLRTYAIRGFIPQEGIIQLSTYQVIINIFPLFTDYLKMLALPVDLNIIHVFHPVFPLFDSRVLLALCSTVIFILVVLIARKKSKGLFFSLLWIVIPLLPVFYIPAFVGESVFAERYLYLPSVGGVVTATLLLKNVYYRRSFKNITTPLLSLSLAIVLVLYTFATIKRNYVWKDSHSLWTDTVRKSPDSSVAHNNIGIAHYESGRIDDAIREYTVALLLKPYNHEAHNNLGNVYYKKGLLDDAIREYQIALSLRPDFEDARYNLSLVYSIRKAINFNKK